MPGKLQTLEQKGYINIKEVEAKVWQISVKCQVFANEQQGVEPFSEDKTRKEKINKDKKSTENIVGDNFKKDSGECLIPGWGNFKKQF